MGMFSAIFKRVWCKKEEGRRGKSNSDRTKKCERKKRYENSVK
jgi:hypothetical protein